MSWSWPWSGNDVVFIAKASSQIGVIGSWGRRRSLTQSYFAKGNRQWLDSAYFTIPSVTDDVDAGEEDFMPVEDSAKKVLVRQPSSALQWLCFLVEGRLAVILCTSIEARIESGFTIS